MFDTLRHSLEKSGTLHRLLSELSDASTRRISISGLAGSFPALLSSVISKETKRQIVIVSPDRTAAQKMYDDLLLLHTGTISTFDVRGAGSLLTAQEIPDTGATLRAMVNSTVDIIVATIDSCRMRLPDPQSVASKCVQLRVGTEVMPTGLVQQLRSAGFNRCDFVAAPGEFSQRGGILDVFSFAGEHPVRIEFLGDTVESIREFDALSQRSIREISGATIMPDLISASDADDSGHASLFEYLKRDALLVLLEVEAIDAALEESQHRMMQSAISAEHTRSHLDRFTQIGVHRLHRANGRIDFQSTAQPSFNGNMVFVREHLLDILNRNTHVIICCDGQAELKRLRELLLEHSGLARDGQGLGPISDVALDVLRTIEFVHPSLHEGFLLREEGVACYTEHQIFGRQKRRGRVHKTRATLTQEELQHLRKGDFIVHDDFGIGRFDGLRRINVRGVDQEVLKLSYEEKDTLYVHLNYLNKVKKYSSKDGHVPKLTRLGSQEWDRLKARVKQRIQDIARDLIRLYARRKSSSGYAYRPDTQWQKELEASFIYEDTFDQAKATLDVKRDMEQPFPMDRLVCGDVGFGKTEVAVRAAFKAVLDGKQAAVLVPTTILAIQHYNTFVDRMSRFSVRVAVLSRLKSSKEQLQILSEVNAGLVDILIGTHRMLSKDVQFKDLGLLIIDEEHRFGVAAKEKLRRLRVNVDTLTLTATPIPRTLHFSLMGARDLSIIATPPRNRLPVITEVAQYEDDLIREAVAREIKRGGQVYFVHDRISDIDLWVNKVRTLFPSLRIQHAHGQMHARELERVMLEFQERRVDILVCTKIIESGLDIPNVNTIIINRADRFGISELYQLKGRVGRSNVQAYAYLLVPPISSLPRTAIQRLQAVEEFTELGSGFNLAMRDLEIRGAGNLLGAEQSGFIESMGFETYTRILDEAVAELKDGEFKDLFPANERRQKATETTVEVEIEALIPEQYIQQDEGRLEIYRRMYALTTTEQLAELADELKDRFGTIPPQLQNLFDVVRIRLTAKAIGFTKVLVGTRAVEIEFPPSSESSFYEGTAFQRLMSEISHFKKRGIHLKQDEKALRMVFELPSQSSKSPILFSLEFLKELESLIAPQSGQAPSEAQPTQ